MVQAAERMNNSWCNALRSEEHTSELQSQSNLVCRLLLEKKKNNRNHLFFLIFFLLTESIRTNSYYLMMTAYILSRTIPAMIEHPCRASSAAIHLDALHRL